MSQFPSAEQHAAIHSDHDRYVVRASAGSGKTSVLVAKYVHHVVDHKLSPDSILTITFTRKAAAEMKARIVETLQHLGLEDEAQIAESGPIQTIHSFCERTLRENSIAAGLDPKFGVINDADAKFLRERALRHVLITADEGDEYIMRLVQHFSGKSHFATNQDIISYLSSLVDSGLSELRGSGQNYSDLEHIYRFADAYRHHVNRLIENDLPEQIRMLLPEYEGNLYQRLVAIRKDTKAKFPQFAKGKLSPEASTTQLEMTCGLGQLCLRVWQMVESEMLAEQRLDYSLLESEAVHLLATNERVRQRINDQYKLVLVDEAQDLNPVQNRLLSQFDSAKQMFVGDPQQSIYGFRLAEVALFEERCVTLPCHALTANHRSDAGILRFVDDVFRTVWPDYQPMSPEFQGLDVFEESPAPDYTGVEVWPYERNLAPERVATYVQQIVEEGIAPGDIAITVLSAGYGAKVLAALEKLGLVARLEGGSESFYTHLVLRDVANALTLCAEPRNKFALLAVMGSPFVRMSPDGIVELATLDMSEFDPQSHVPLLESDRDRWQHFLSWFELTQVAADRRAAWEIVTDLYNRTNYLAELAKGENAKQDLANARKVFELAADSPDMGPIAFADRVRNVRRINHKEGEPPPLDSDEQVITIMTVHKAKGLEFPVVIVPELERARRISRNVFVDKASGVIDINFGKELFLHSSWLRQREETRGDQEWNRVGYVAMTRAKQRLCIGVRKSAQAPSLSHFVKRVIPLVGVPPKGLVVRQEVVDDGLGEDPTVN